MKPHEQKKLLICSEFVKRQTKTSRFSHTDLSWEELVQLTKENFNNHTEGYRNGVKLVHVPANGFYCAVGKVSDVKEWEEVIESRQEGEEPVRTRYGIVDKKPEAKYVDIVLYRDFVLDEDEDYDITKSEGQWEIISINARTEEEPYPIPPMTMARNFLVEKGGTKGEYTAEEFAKSIWFWNKHCLVKER